MCVCIHMYVCIGVSLTHASFLFGLRPNKPIAAHISVTLVVPAPVLGWHLDTEGLGSVSWLMALLCFARAGVAGRACVRGAIFLIDLEEKEAQG